MIAINVMGTSRKPNDVRQRTLSVNDAMQPNQEILNPCYKEHVLSLKCLDSNQKNQKACEIYFTNYKNCKDFWASVRIERRLKGIKPDLPPLKERKEIKDNFLKSKRQL